jgi:hypothetical protein
MSHRARTAAFSTALALVMWAVIAADSNSADDKGGKVGPYNADILKLIDGKGSADEIAKKADLGDVMQVSASGRPPTPLNPTASSRSSLRSASRRRVSPRPTYRRRPKPSPRRPP